MTRKKHPFAVVKPVNDTNFVLTHYSVVKFSHADKTIVSKLYKLVRDNYVNNRAIATDSIISNFKTTL